MTYRDDLDAAHARADALQRRVDELEAEKRALVRREPAALSPDVRKRRLGRAGAAAALTAGAGLATASAFVADSLLRVILIAAAAGCLPIAMSLALLATRYLIAGPDEALVITGGNPGPRVIAPGRGTFVAPIVEQAQRLDLRPVDANGTLAAVYTKGGTAVGVTLAATVRIRRTDAAIRRAAERFLGAEPPIADAGRQVLEGAIRGVLADLDADAVRRDPERVSDLVGSRSRDDLDRLGLEAETLHVRVA